MHNESPTEFPTLKKLSYIANIIIAITAIVGLVYVLIQLQLFIDQNKTLQTQTETLNESLLQSYRPLGHIAFIDPEDKGRVAIDVPPEGRKEKLSFIFRPILINKGNGVLINIGHIYYITKEQIEFRNNLINNKIGLEDILFDWKYGYSRREALLPNDQVTVSVRFDDIEFEDEYYLYILSFYEDQDGNLYDTENRNVMKFNPPILVEDRMMPHLKEIYMSNVYHKYNQLEKEKLFKIIEAREHPMVNYFSNKNNSGN